MMTQRLNIPAVLVHTIKNKQYKVNGIILSINESNDTCTMRFPKDNLIERNIPMNKVLISEGFLDKIKEYGKKVTNFIVKKVKGFIALVDETTNKVLNWSIQNIGNLAIQAAKNELPEGVYFAPSKSLQKIAGVGGMSIDNALAESLNNDINEINKFWQRVIKRAGTTKDETVAESVRYVKENYYKINPTYKKLYESHKLNENVIYTIDDVQWGENKTQSLYGEKVGAKVLQAKLTTNIQNQISGPLGGHSDQKPYIIWGAPGIGKTAIVHQVIKQLATRKFGKTFNLSLICVQLSTLTVESWTLPKDFTAKRGDAVEVASFGDTPPCWLPVYMDGGNQQINAERDMYYNSCKYLAPNEDVEMVSDTGAAFEGGIIFFDEYTRRQPGIDKNLMGLVNEHRFGANYKLASKWGFIFAANRAMDDGPDVLSSENENPLYHNIAAVNDRFLDITYVPTKEEWLKWAKKVNEETGEAKIMPFIVDFIEASDENVWYSTITNGGYDDLFDRSDIDSIKKAHERGKDDVAEVLRRDELVTKRMITPRTWDKINKEFKKEIIKLFEENPEGIDGEEYYKKLVKKSVIEKTDKDGNSYKEYYGSILPDILMDALNNIDEEYWEFWVDEHGGQDYLDPSGSFTGIRGRYNMLMSLFVKIMQTNMNDNANPEVSQSPVMKQWRAYNSYARAFTPDNIESIWETGHVLDQYQKDDDKVTDFRNTTYSKWKQNTALINEVLNKVFEAYPGNLESDVQEDLANIKSAKKLPDATVKAEAERLNNEYSFKIGNKTVNLLFNKNDFNNIDILGNKVTTLLNSKVAQNFAHVALWIAKIAIQTRQTKYAVDFTNHIMSKFREDIDSDLSQEVLKVREINEIMNKKKKDPSNPNLKKEYELLSSKILIISAANILSQAKSYEFDKARK